MTELVFDDTAPDLRYFGTWFLGGSLNEFNSTVHGTHEPGARIELSFTGASVEVRGSVSSAGPVPISTYVIDGGRPVTFSPTQAAQAQFNRTFFRSELSPHQPHLLSITATVDGALLLIDSIVVTAPDGVSPPTTPTTGFPASFSTEAAAASGRPLAPGVVFGIAIGSSLLLGGAVAAFTYLACRRRRRTNDHEFRARSVLTPKRKMKRITAFVSNSSKRLLVVPPGKPDVPPMSTRRYELPPAEVAPPKPAVNRDSPPQRPRPPNLLGQSPPRRNILVVNNH